MICGRMICNQLYRLYLAHFGIVRLDIFHNRDYYCKTVAAAVIALNPSDAVVGAVAVV